LILVILVEYAPNLPHLPVAGHSRPLARECPAAAGLESRNPFAATNRVETWAIPDSPGAGRASPGGEEEEITRISAEEACLRRARAPETGAAARAIAFQFVNWSLRGGKNAAIFRTTRAAREVRPLQRKLRRGRSLALQKSNLTNN
jgi:hypothetical protein